MSVLGWCVKYFNKKAPAFMLKFWIQPPARDYPVSFSQWVVWHISQGIKYILIGGVCAGVAGMAICLGCKFGPILF